MINMYGPMMFGSMYGLGNPMYGMYSNMYGSMTSSNVHQYYHQKYGCGYEDFGHTPYLRGYPMGIEPIPKVYDKESNWLVRFLKKCFD